MYLTVKLLIIISVENQANGQTGGADGGSSDPPKTCPMSAFKSSTSTGSCPVASKAAAEVTSGHEKSE